MNNLNTESISKILKLSIEYELLDSSVKRGKAIFSSLTLLFPDMANRIRGTIYDCSNDDNKIGTMINFISGNQVEYINEIQVNSKFEKILNSVEIENLIDLSVIKLKEYCHAGKSFYFALRLLFPEIAISLVGTRLDCFDDSTRIIELIKFLKKDESKIENKKSDLKPLLSIEQIRKIFELSFVDTASKISEYRIGQSFFNNLRRLYPSMTNEVVTLRNDLDCFFKDDKTIDLVCYLLNEKNPANAVHKLKYEPKDEDRVFIENCVLSTDEIKKVFSNSFLELICAPSSSVGYVFWRSLCTLYGKVVDVNLQYVFNKKFNNTDVFGLCEILTGNNNFLRK